jgi:hypothetical protein
MQEYRSTGGDEQTTSLGFAFSLIRPCCPS